MMQKPESKMTDEELRKENINGAIFIFVVAMFAYAVTMAL